MSFKSQKGVVTLLTVLLWTFSICGLLTTGAKVYTHIEEKIEMDKVAKMMREGAHNLKEYHTDDPRARAQAEAWERMAHSIETHEDVFYSKKMLKEAFDVGLNLIPGRLPLVGKGTKEAVELAKDIYDTDKGLEEAYRDEPEEPSCEMKDFLKSLSKGKIDADALEIVMLQIREQAVVRAWEKLLEEKKADEEWQRQQEEHLDKYRDMFIQNTLNKLNETGELSSYYKRLWSKPGLQEELAKYPQIAKALKEAAEEEEEVAVVTQEEKEEINDLVHQLVSQNETLKEALKKTITKKQGDWEKDADQIESSIEKAFIPQWKLREEYEKKKTVCVPEWECGPWQCCVDENEVRTCWDKNNCGVDEGKPEEVRPSQVELCKKKCEETYEKEEEAFIEWDETEEEKNKQRYETEGSACGDYDYNCVLRAENRWSEAYSKHREEAEKRENEILKELQRCLRSCTGEM